MYRAGLVACQLGLVPMVRRPREWGGAVEMLRRAGIRVLSGMLGMIGEDYTTLESIRRTGGVALDGDWDDNFQLARAVARIAADNSIPLVTFHAGFLPHDRRDPRRGILVGRVRAISDLFAAHNVRVALETGQETAETLLDVLDELDSPNVGINFDPANMILYGMGDPVESLRRLGPRVEQIHIKDALPSRTPGTWGTETRVGEGAVDWDSLLRVAESQARKVDFVIEREAGESRLADIMAAKTLLPKHAALKGA